MSRRGGIPAVHGGEDVNEHLPAQARPFIQNKLHGLYPAPGEATRVEPPSPPRPEWIDPDEGMRELDS